MSDAAEADEDRHSLMAAMMFDAFGNRRERFVRVRLDCNICVMSPQEGDTYAQDAKDAGDTSEYVISDVYLSQREFDDLPEHEGF
jgi:hypothetical protein